MEIALAVICGAMAIGLILAGLWLLDGWVNTSSIGVIAVLAIFAIVFVGAGFLAVVALGAVIVVLFGAIGSSQ